jgi:hypothetical protein
MSTAIPPELKAREHPRISLNKLGEYLEATPIRRRAIVKDQKKPPGAAVVTRYGPVTQVLKEYFEYADKDFLLARIADMKADHSGTIWQREDRQLSAQTLERMTAMLDDIDMSGIKIVPFPLSAKSVLFVSGVRISVRPDFLIVSASDPVIAVGALKLSHNKQNPLTKTGCEYVATVLARFVGEAFASPSVSLKHCLSVSTPLQLVVQAPKAQRAKGKTIDAACEEIAGGWKAA